MHLIKIISSNSFASWLRTDPENRLLLKISTIAIILLFGLFKIFYPYPNFMPPDSNSYLEAALSNQFINLWPIGYSKFLRLVSCFSNSHLVLVSIQYFLIQISCLFFLFSIRYWVVPGKWAFRLLLIISILNPLLVHIANFVSSDALFTALSMIWFTQLLWILYKPTMQMIVLHSIIILLALMVRFTAIYYPFISMALIFLSPCEKMVKLRGIGSVILFSGIFIYSTMFEYKSKTNTIQYSAFGGWQLGSNALYGYVRSTPISIAKVPPQFRPLHLIVNKRLESLKLYPPSRRPDNEVAVYYLWGLKSPLRIYMNELYPHINDDDFFYKWATLGPLYGSYGLFLIKQRPGYFFKYYLWPNFLKYYAPPTKFMGLYNMKSEKVEPSVVKWFGWKTNRLPTYFVDRTIKITEAFPILFALINLLFILGIISLFVLGGFRNLSKTGRHMLYLIISVWFVNMVFSVFSAPIELRYQIFPFIFTLVCSSLLIGHLIFQILKAAYKSPISETTVLKAAI